MNGIALRPLSTGEILDVAFSLYRRQFLTLAMVALVSQGVALVLSIYVEASGGIFANPGLYLVSLMVGSICAAVGMGASTKIIADLYLSRTTTVGEALSWVVPYVGRIVLLTLAAGFLVGLGMVAFLVPGLILASGWAVAACALVVEGVAPMDALNRSWQLTKGHRWKVFGTLVVALLLIYCASMAAVFIAGILAAIASGGSLVAVIIAAGFSTLAVVVGYPFLYAAIVVLYYDLRVRKEGFDLELLESQLARS